MIGNFYSELVVISSRLTSWHTYYDLQSQAQPLIKATAADDERIRGEIDETLPLLARLARLLEMTAVSAQIPRVINARESETATVLARAINDLLTRLGDELKQRTFLYVAPLFANMYENSQPFGGKVESAFPSVVFDIREAAKCIALDLPTASVLHLMRVLDGLMQRGINPRLGITFTRPSWDTYIRAIRGKVAEQPKLPRVNWNRDARFYADIAADLDSIRIVWRNPSTHSVATQYSRQEAMLIMGSVGPDPLWWTPG